MSQCTRLTDGRTDGILIARPRLHSMQRSNNTADNQDSSTYRSQFSASTPSCSTTASQATTSDHFSFCFTFNPQNLYTRGLNKNLILNFKLNKILPINQFLFESLLLFQPRTKYLTYLRGAAWPFRRLESVCQK